MSTDDTTSPLSSPGIFPATTAVTPDGALSIGGCTVSSLAERFGTPLYVFDAQAVRTRAADDRAALRESYPGPSSVSFAAKAYCAPWIVRLVGTLGLGLDVVSGGELHVARTVGFPADRVSFHGNDKSIDELRMAVTARVGRIVVDNLEEIAALGALTAGLGVRQAVLLRVSPGVDAHTHAHLTTGTVDTKFGLGIGTGEADRGIDAILSRPSLELHGIHAHIGSQIFEPEPYAETIERLFAFSAAVRARTGVSFREISPGGGYGVRYTPDAPEIDPVEMVRQVGRLAAEAAARHGFSDALPALTIEPGRSLVASAAVAVYRVGSVKVIPGGRTYVAVDGGMADNIRPTAYGAEYTAVLADRPAAPGTTEVAVAGRYCETGDILIQRVRLPDPAVGDLVVIPGAGAYQLSMASHYNLAPGPAVVVVADGRATLTRRRETYDDLLVAEVLDAEV